jgi:hypothetical protein
VNVDTGGRDVGAAVVGAGLGVAVAPPPGCAVDGPEGVEEVLGWLELGAIVLAVPVGAGAAACVVAGRFAHPVPIAARTSSDVTTQNEPRVAMTPPFDLLLSARCNA